MHEFNFDTGTCVLYWVIHLVWINTIDMFS